MVVTQTGGTGTAAGTAFGDLTNQAFVAGAATLSGTLTNDGDDAATVRYVFTPNLAGVSTCAGAALAPIDIIVEPTPSLTPTLQTPAAICSGDLVNITLANNSTSSVLGALTYGVTVASSTGFLTDITGEEPIDGLIGQVYALAITIPSLVNNTSASLDVTFTFTPEIAGCASGLPQDIVVTVDPAPIMTSANAETICSGGSPTISFISDSPATYLWTVTSVTNVTRAAVPTTGTDLTTEVLTNTSGGPGSVTYDVVATGTTGLTCTGPTQVVTITVDPAPVMTSANAETICSGNTPGISFSSNVVGSTFNWVVTSVVNVSGTFIGNFANGAVDFSGELLTNFAPVPGTVTYDVTPIGPVGLGCIGIAQVVTITVDPGPAGVADAEEECSNVALNYDIQADNIDNGGNNVLSQFTYNISEITASGILLESNRTTPSTLPIVFNYVNTTTTPAIVRYTITPIGFGACAAGTPFDVDFTINPEPVINAQTVTICSKVPLTISPTLANFAIGDVTIEWEVTNISGAVIGINVNDTDISDPFPHVLTNISSGPAVITYTFTATANILNNCVSATEDILVTVDPEPVGTPTTITAVCSDELFSLSLDAFVPNLAGNTYAWIVDYGVLSGAGPSAGTSISETITNTTAAPVNVVYTITPTSSGGSCQGSTFDITVPINPEPVLDDALNPFPTCSDVISGIILDTEDTPLSVGAASYDIVLITWDVGLLPGGSNASIGPGQPDNALENDLYTNTTNGTLFAHYTIIPVSADGCQGDPQVVNFEVNPAPALSTTLDELVCNSEVSGIVLGTTPASEPAVSYDIIDIVVDGGLNILVHNATFPRKFCNFTGIICLLR